MNYREGRMQKAREGKWNCKVSYGKRRTEKVHGTRNEYRRVKKDDYRSWSFIRTLTCESVKDFCSKPQKSLVGGAKHGN